MPNTGDSYQTMLKSAHLHWGTLRYTDTREPIDGEVYIQIPANDAYRLNILKGSVYHATSSCGNFRCRLRASGNQSDPNYAKQFQSDGDLKVLGAWLHGICHAQVGHQVEVYWDSPTSVILTYI